ncbi:hypothetical protein [Mesorhizobium temperatum]|uniref:hypothetical protein n=1 Tax=Mesorhizobium temperatum TaxID=241416 RepID=UPI00142E1E88
MARMLVHAAQFGHCGAQGVAIIGAVGEQDVPGVDGLEHVGGRATVVGMALGQQLGAG